MIKEYEIIKTIHMPDGNILEIAKPLHKSTQEEIDTLYKNLAKIIIRNKNRAN